MPAGRTPKPVDARTGHRKGKSINLGDLPDRRSIPKPPDKLLPSSKKAWRNYWQSDLGRAADSKVDLPRITRWIRVLDQFERYFDVLIKTPLVRGSTGQPVLNPIATFVTTLMTELRYAEMDLGLTPLARLRLGIAYGQPKLTMQDLNQRVREELAAEGPVDAWWEDEWEQVQRVVTERR